MGKPDTHRDRKTTPDLAKLGARVKRHRKRRGWTQQKLAEKCDLHLTYVNSIERGRRNVSFLTIIIIARALKVPVTALFSDK